MSLTKRVNRPCGALKSGAAVRSGNAPNLTRCMHALWIAGTFVIVFHMGLSSLSRAVHHRHVGEVQRGKIGRLQHKRVLLEQRGDWAGLQEVPGFCQRLIENPRPFRKECKRDLSSMYCRNLGGAAMMFSQFQQDYYLYTRHFSKMGRAGIYLDIATNDPVSISNTYFMDRCLGWKGVCVEANPQYYEKIHRLRSCHLVPTCVSRKDGHVVEMGLYGGAGGIMDSTNKHIAKWNRQNVSVPTLVERCTTVQNILDRTNVGVIDYLSLDVEGHEAQVLRGVDWERTKINVITIEVTGDSLKELEELLEGLGYKRHIPDLDETSKKTGKLREDVVFLHADVEFGNPV